MSGLKQLYDLTAVAGTGLCPGSIPQQTLRYAYQNQSGPSIHHDG